jgi:hypothetical protein
MRQREPSTSSVGAKGRRGRGGPNMPQRRAERGGGTVWPPDGDHRRRCSVVLNGGRENSYLDLRGRTSSP